MDEELRQTLAAIESRLERIEKTTRRTYQIFFWGAIISIALFVLPLIGLVFAVPSFLSSYSNITSLQ